MSRMMQRVQELGGTIDDSLTPETTHVVCALDTDERSVQERLPASRSLQLVTPEFISRSIITHSLQNEENFRPKFSRDRPASRQSMVGEDLGDSEREDRPAKRQKVDQGSAQHGPTHAASGPVAPNAQSHKATTDLATPGPVKGEGRSPRHPADRTAPPAGTSPSGPCKVVRRGAEWVAVQGSKPAFTGGHTGIPWGSCGVWDEPYDEALARETVEKLKQYWYTTKGELPPGEENGSSRAEGEGNGVCGHVACSKRPYCLVVRLGEVKKVYLEGRDHFQIKVTNTID